MLLGSKYVIYLGSVECHMIIIMGTSIVYTHCIHCEILLYGDLIKPSLKERGIRCDLVKVMICGKYENLNKITKI